MNYRLEYDSIGEIAVPSDALYGAQTQRAVENFPVSGLRMPRQFIRALGPAGVPAPAAAAPGVPVSTPYFEFVPKNLPQHARR